MLSRTFMEQNVNAAPRGTLLSHIELNVSDYTKSIRFYDLILTPLGWRRLVTQKSHTVFSDGQMKIILSPVIDEHKTPLFHRKKVGLNHLAFYASSRKFVDDYVTSVLKPNGIQALYPQDTRGDDTYYAVYFEDPDRIKIEVVFAPGYCSAEHWTNKFENDFDPYK
ncbi:MAG: VOC family protein [Bdellovibrio sp.]|nr:VOC family protein [Bdellovibrio sp.]